MKLKHILGVPLAVLMGYALGSCDTINEDERLIFVGKAEVNRSVLIEDFTGQRCVNCPVATEELEKLQRQYGEDAIIVVGIHSGPFGHRTTMSSPRLPLCTETGDAYYTHWGIESQPGVMINRSAPIYNPAQYNDVVSQIITKSTPLDLALDAQYDAETRNVAISIQATANKDVSGKLQVWVVENNIVAQQSMPDGSNNPDYVHQHVFRTSVTDDIYGDDISIEGNTAVAGSVEYQTTLADDWKPEDIAVVAFVSNAGEGVLQVVKTKLTIND